MPDDASLPDRLTRAVEGGPPGFPLAGRVCVAARDLLGAEGASVTIDNPTLRRVTLWATDERAGELENLQDVLGEGPCRDAFGSRLPVFTRVDRWAASRWPNFIPAAERIVGPHGHLWSLPMHARLEVIGTLSMYRACEGSLAQPIDTFQAVADTAGALLLSLPPAEWEITHERRWPQRAVVHRAVGQLAALFGLSPSDAMALLRSQAFITDAQLADVAREVINGTLDLSGH